MIQVKREPTGYAGSKFSVYVDGKVWCHTNQDDDGFRLMIAVNRLKAKAIVEAAKAA